MKGEDAVGFSLVTLQVIYTVSSIAEFVYVLCHLCTSYMYGGMCSRIDTVQSHRLAVTRVVF